MDSLSHNTKTNDMTTPMDETNVLPRKSIWFNIQVFTVCIIKLVLIFIAAYLSWQCSSTSNGIIRSLLATISGFFSEIYIIYYSFYRVFMGNTCPI